MYATEKMLCTRCRSGAMKAMNNNKGPTIEEDPRAEALIARNRMRFRCTLCSRTTRRFSGALGSIYFHTRTQPKNIIFVHYLYVELRYRRQKIASKLVEALLEKFPNVDTLRSSVFTEAALPFWRRFGKHTPAGADGYAYLRIVNRKLPTRCLRRRT